MSLETSIVAAQYCLKEWVAQIRECQSRPAGMALVSGVPATALQRRIIITDSAV